jgi:DNA-binding Lrp family transcriptional regulator
MDAIGKNILTNLMMNCRTTYEEMAVKNNISANAIKKRISNMISVGVIERFIIALSVEMLNAEMLMCLIYTNGREDSDQFINEIGNDPRFGAVGRASGSIYVIFATYLNGTIGIGEIRAFFGEYPFVKEVELFPLILERGSRIELSITELTILKYLYENPRMSFSEITTNTGISSKMVHDIIKNLIDNKIIRFSIHWNPGDGGAVFVMIKIEWDEKKANFLDVLAILPKNFPDEYFLPAGICATHPIIFAAFILNNTKPIPEISKKIRSFPFIKAVTAIIGEPNKTFSDYSTIRLKEMIDAVKLPF